MGMEKAACEGLLFVCPYFQNSNLEVNIRQESLGNRDCRDRGGLSWECAIMGGIKFESWLEELRWWVCADGFVVDGCWRLS
jgi:hypothetical protein